MSILHKIFTKAFVLDQIEGLISFLSDFFVFLFFSIMGVFFAFVQIYPNADYEQLTKNFLTTNIGGLAVAVIIFYTCIEFSKAITGYFLNADMGSIFDLRRNEPD